MGYHEHKKVSPVSVTTAVVVVSDSRSVATDESGKLIRNMLTECGHTVKGLSLVKNDREQIYVCLLSYVIDPEIQAVILSGGTGLSHRDITIETVAPLFEKRIDGFGELFRTLSYQEIGAGCILSRAQAGVVSSKLVICLPGSLKATQLAMEKALLPELGHLIREINR
jgi:molybdenum cofactor biosynthesis protein B